MKFIDTGNMDFEIPKAKLGNYFYGNILISTKGIISFEFPEELQTEDFYLEELVFNNDSMTYTFENPLLLDNSFKKTGYFENHNFATELTVGIYRLKAGSYYSSSLLNAKKIIESFFNENEILNYDNENIKDWDDSNITEPLN